MSEQVNELQFKVFRWNPRWADLAPVGVWLAISLVLQMARIWGANAQSVLRWLSPLADLAFIVLTMVFIHRVDRKPLETIGVTKRRLLPAAIVGLGVGVVFGWLSLSGAIGMGNLPILPDPLSAAAYLVHMLFHLIAVELFYRGWLATRMEESYGFLIAILVSGFFYAMSPLILWGTDPTVPAGLSSLNYFWVRVFPFTLFIGVLLAGLARLTRNLAAPILVMLPQTLVSDLLPGQAAHLIPHPQSAVISTLALTGIAVVVFWLTKPEKRPV